MNKQRLMIVDDDPRLIRLVREVLTAVGYEVIACSSGGQAVECFALEQPQLVLLDIMLKDTDGFQVCSQIREFSDVPIIMLTAKVNEADKLTGFDCGADDYITKPFSSKELLARIRAVLNRTRKEGIAPQDTRIVCGELQVDLPRRHVTLGGQEIYLTAIEYNLLHELVTHIDQVLLHEQLLTAVWGSEYRDDVDYLRSYIHLLRRKLEHNPAKPQLIKNIQGVGYMLVGPKAERKPDKILPISL
jgi:two-component system, OmpR family, KDP operon response regulator KdpE